MHLATWSLRRAQRHGDAVYTAVRPALASGKEDVFVNESRLSLRLSVIVDSPVKRPCAV